MLMKTIQKKMNSKGFTILEVMMGMVIFSIGLLTLLSMVVLSIHGNDWSDATTTTTQMVQQTIEELKNTPEASMEDYGYDYKEGIYRSWYVEDVYEVSGLKKVTVYVYWHDSFENPQYTQTSTYFQPKQ